ncbi:MAG: precorrin-6y C5,15-methyltransferase (decarboxylating) subunit CbiE [Prevotella sp.]|nr:precorrin-6y C5,15-methyltransferase (decarboxylating) subunit CbiE [Prevotella sp.]
MKFIVIGITDNPQPYFPPEVMEVISHGQVFSGGKRHHEIMAPLLPDGAEWIDITVPLDAVFQCYAQHFSRQPETLIVFASGDPLFFGFANTIRRKLPDAQVVVYPAFNSLQMLAHRLVMPYHDLRIVSLTGRPWHEFDRALIERAPKLGVLTDREHTPAAIARRMLDYGYTNYNMSVGEHLGNPSAEVVGTFALNEAAQRDFTHPNCLILTKNVEASSGQKVEPRLPESRPFGIPEGNFALLDGREKMITKMPIRLLSLQALDLPQRHVLWDIGFCTGSVSIEARLLFPHLHVVSFEVRPECEAIIHENARRFGAPGIEVHIGDFLSAACDDIVAASSRPDAVFIGGHGGHLLDIMAKVKPWLAPGGVIVMNSVSSAVVDRMTARPSSRQQFDEACRSLGLVQQPPLHIALNDFNPIEILKCELPS